MLAYGYLLAPPRGSPTGPLARPGYEDFALAGAAIMVISVLASALGTHRRLARFHDRRIESQSVRHELRAISKTLSNRAFLALMAAGVFAYINQGIAFAMANYLLGFVWLFRPLDFLSYAASLFAGVVLAFFIVTPVARALGKRGAAAVMAVLASATGTIPYWLRLADAFPKPGDPALLPLLLGFLALATGLGVCVMMLIGSMVADVVEASEERSGRREEGLFFAGNLLMQKCTSGLGIFISGLILSLADFPDRAVPGRVPAETLDRLTLYVAALTMAIGLISAWLFTRFPISKADHEARLAKLAVAAPASTGEIGETP
jgi:glycoside/pentoside/hexuronide:cation symporter, GPH family